MKDASCPSHPRFAQPRTNAKRPFGVSLDAITPRATRQTARTRRAAARLAISKKCVIYLRVSTDEQVSSGLGLDAQEASCRRWAEANGLTVVEVVTEQAVSGKVAPPNRPGFARALALLDGCRGS